MTTTTPARPSRAPRTPRVGRASSDTELRIAYGRKEAAAAFGVSTDLIDKAIASGAIKAKRTGFDRRGRPAGRYLMRKQALEDWYEGLPDA